MRRMILASAMLLFGCDSGTVADAKRSLEAKLKDASSVEYRDVSDCPTDGMVIGQFNAKNSFGAFTGFEPFVAYKGISYLRSDVQGLDTSLPPDDQFIPTLIRACYGKGKPLSLGEYVELRQAQLTRPD